MKRLLTILSSALFFVLTQTAGAAISPKQASTLAPGLITELEAHPDHDLFEILVTTGSSDAASDLRTLAASAPTRTRRYDAVVDRLQQDAAQNQNAALAAVRANATAHIEVLRRFWISETMHLRVNRAALEMLAERDDVRLITPNAEIQLMRPVTVKDAVATEAGAQANLSSVGVRSVWARGLTGRGRLVASIDTGVEGTHPALTDRWRGLHGDTAASWFDPYNAASPIDPSGHGTHVMGVMVGRSGADTIGLAPDAEWISASVIDRGSSLATTFADIISALEWVADPDGNPATVDDVPDVVCNSWGVAQHIINPCDTLFFQAIDNVEALGIVCIFAAGNEGPFSSTIRNPADRGGSPTLSFAVGAVDAASPTYDVPSFSSRGPSACDGVSIKPEVAAPGVDIRSAYKGGGYKVISGTSMAAPHVAAAIALMRQYNPDLTPEEMKLAIMESALDIGAVGEDNKTGHGLLDLEAAIDLVRPPTPPVVAIAAVAPDAPGDAILAPGETGSLTVALEAGDVPIENVSATLTSLSTGISVDVDSAYYTQIPSYGTADNSAMPFEITVAPDFAVGDSIYLEFSLRSYPSLQYWTDTIGVICGLPQGAEIRTVGSGSAALSVSNFGHIGLGAGSILDAGGAGWQSAHVPTGFLYETSLILTAADGRMADASRRLDGAVSFDFAPQPAPNQVAAAVKETVWFDDSRAPNPLGVAIEQTAAYHASVADYDLTIITWTIRERRGIPIAGLQVGWLTDIDMPGIGGVAENVAVDYTTEGYYHMAGGSPQVAGVIPLGFVAKSLTFVENTGGKTGLLRQEKLAGLGGGKAAAPSTTGDWLELLATHAINLGAGDSVSLALAFIVGADQSAFAAGRDDAQHRWAEISEVFGEGGGAAIARTFELSQNYPNPFNASTTIPITVGAFGARDVQLDVYDILGRRVRTLYTGALPPGIHPIDWDGRDRNGHPAASGVYLYRLTLDGHAEARSMVLLK